MSTRTPEPATGPREIDHHARDASIPAKLAIAWTFVGVPLAYGVFKTVQKASALF